MIKDFRSWPAFSGRRTSSHHHHHAASPFRSRPRSRGLTCDEIRGQLERHGFEILRHALCFHWIMRALLVVYRWQFETLRKGRRSSIPPVPRHFAGVLDRFLQLGKPWELSFWRDAFLPARRRVRLPQTRETAVAESAMRVGSVSAEYEAMQPPRQVPQPAPAYCSTPNTGSNNIPAATYRRNSK
jgi:hypothetical protein